MAASPALAAAQEPQQQGGAAKAPRSPSPERKAKASACSLALRLLAGTAEAELIGGLAEKMFFESMPIDNVQDLRCEALDDARSRGAFMRVLAEEGGDLSRIRMAWHLAGSSAAATAIATDGIRCDDGHCMCGRYGRGGYVATNAAKSNAYADSEVNGSVRHLFLVLALPEPQVLPGERGLRPRRTAADLPSHPTEYCFVDPERLHCVCRLTYSWVPTGRRSKVLTAGNHARAWRSLCSELPAAVSASL